MVLSPLECTHALVGHNLLVEQAVGWVPCRVESFSESQMKGQVSTITLVTTAGPEIFSLRTFLDKVAAQQVDWAYPPENLGPSGYRKNCPEALQDVNRESQNLMHISTPQQVHSQAPRPCYHCAIQILGV